MPSNITNGNFSIPNDSDITPMIRLKATPPNTARKKVMLKAVPENSV